jgi:predicted CXXCH cytochrome family protein
MLIYFFCKTPGETSGTNIWFCNKTRVKKNTTFFRIQRLIRFFVMKNFNLIQIIAFFILFSLVSIVAAENIKSAKTETGYCLRCHGMETLAYWDKNTGLMVNLSVNSEQYRQSNHQNLACVDCHRADYSGYPHAESVKQETLYCLDCHQNDPKLVHYQFDEIEQAFKKSVHAQQFPEQFSCFSCHDPHQFKVSESGEDLADIVRHGNRICSNCHQTVLNHHQWLPNPSLHWRSVRCIECHTATTLSHQVLPAAQSTRLCVECHSKEATLLTRLYQYRSEQDLQKTGWFNNAVFNQAYIIGMSRNDTIDRWALIILGLTVVGLFAHGLGRFLASQLRSHQR